MAYLAQGLGSGPNSVAIHIARDVTMERKKKLTQFINVFHVLSKGKPMVDYETSLGLYRELKVPDLPKEALV